MGAALRFSSARVTAPRCSPSSWASRSARDEGPRRGRPPRRAHFGGAGERHQERNQASQSRADPLLLSRSAALISSSGPGPIPSRYCSLGAVNCLAAAQSSCGTPSALFSTTIRRTSRGASLDEPALAGRRRFAAQHDERHVDMQGRKRARPRWACACTEPSPGVSTRHMNGRASSGTGRKSLDPGHALAVVGPRHRARGRRGGLAPSPSLTPDR